MFLFHLFRSFLPIHNPIGFGAADFIDLAIACVLLLLACTVRPWLEPAALRLAPRMGRSMLLVAALPVVLRLLLLSQHPVPSPVVSDEFSHLLVADTLLHFRLANPSHPLHQFFETYFVLQQPTYSSIYALGQGMVLALGSIVFGHPWCGVVLSIAALCSLCYWMLRAWTTPGWAFVGGLLAVIEFGPLNRWMNCYWGGAVSAVAGCLVFGALPRLRQSPQTRDALLLGLGLSLQLLTRPFESILLLAGALLYFLPELLGRADLGRLMKVAPTVMLAVLPAIALTFAQNKQVTGSWTTLPYMLSRYQYGVPTTFTFEPNPVPHRALTTEQQLDYQVQTLVHGNQPDTVTTYLERLGFRLRFGRFFLLAPLYLALPFFLPALREFRFAWLLSCLAIFALGSNFYPYFYPHYIAAVTPLFVLLSVTGLEQMSRLSIRGWPAGQEAARIILLLCAAQFLFSYGLHVFDSQEFSVALRQYETWDEINHRDDAKFRIAFNQQLAQLSGKHIVFVRYWPQHRFDEWVHNAAADIDAERIVWARDLGPAEDQKLCRYYPDRTAWLLEPDAKPPRLTPYPHGAP